jgi:4-hydroxybenzoate polyprenyltransferase
VDLDGTLLRTDTLFETAAWQLRHAPWRLVVAPLCLVRGIAPLKRWLARDCALDPRRLPHHEAFLEFLRRERSTGRRMVLATGSDTMIAHRVARSLGIFDEVIASDGVGNLTGKRKAAALQSRFGQEGFDYAGNHSADLAVWSESRRSIAVGAPPRVLRRLQRQGRMEAHFPAPHGRGWTPFVEALRPHQWLKNLLLLVPVFTSHHWGEPETLARLAEAFVAVSLSASCAYLLNDLWDLEHDRSHPDKLHRPLAAGRLSIRSSVMALPLLTGAALVLGWTLGPAFLAWLASYIALTLAYSAWLKRIALVDVFVLAAMYTLRILMGGAAAGIAISSWLLAFAVFYFLSLAFAKRFTELHASSGSPSQLAGRGYEQADQPLVSQAGIASGFVAVLVFALYLQSPEVRRLYRTPEILWGCCPVLLFWQSRLWLIAIRGRLCSDPVLFALKDPVSYVTGALVLAIVMAAH